ncbi:uncharacterized protein BKA55DRAFT_504504 [Fusarium redolens]|uniref:Extracellular membrane protein CFEM domain-containing protein n=1 Tax=Fusarium redolens TaxID=48865 RepID=A0A9P9HPL9_FUSRE|nr:uncharacterized protein BKA55DRAFT_504504 [Fusarium redolens]KAH7261499.1 hypothetical protein BKA55DRAFT_504504 [Fusarium redolens]
MKHLHCLSWVGLLGLAVLTTAKDVSYVTDLEIFTYLAPCVSSAISYNVGMQTYSTMCGDSETELQKCICSTRMDEVASSISTDIEYSCGSSATEDLSSASKLMQKYCNQEEHITFFSPTKNIVEAYITDLPELAYLPPCAQSGLSYAVVNIGSSRCPEAAELNAPCVCNKKDVVRDITSTLKSAVKYSCSNNGDVTSAQNFYSEFCQMNDGTTSFAPPKGPPGDTMPHFKSLNKCAQSGIASAVMEQSSWLCGEGPQELASCICIKSGMSKIISSSLTERVKDYCDSTHIANVTSAIDVFRYYCSAAESLVVATVSQSIFQSYPTASSGAGSGTTVPGMTGSVGATATSSSNTAKESDPGHEDKDDSESKTSIAPIAGGVAGVVILAALGAGLFLCIRRKRQRQAKGEELSNNADGPPEYSGHPELMGNSAYIKGHTAPPIVSELSSTTSFKPELGGGQGISELPPNHAPTAELQAHLAKSNWGHSPAQSEYVSPSGPVEAYELDSNIRGR